MRLGQVLITSLIVILFALGYSFGQDNPTETLTDTIAAPKAKKEKIKKSKEKSAQNSDNPNATQFTETTNDSVDFFADELLPDTVFNQSYGSSDVRYSTYNTSGRLLGKDISSMPVSTFEAALQGQVAGLQVTQLSGAMPGASVRTLIRGTHSIHSASEPLYVVDDMPVMSHFYGPANDNNILGATLSPLAYINPHDIESITILKDGEAKALYGARGANGVIVIRTKRGLAKRDTGYTIFDYNQSISSMTGNIDYVNSSEWLLMADEGKKNYYGTGYIPFQPYNTGTTGNRTLTRELANNTNTNWKDAVVRNAAVTREYNVLGTRGFKDGSFFLSGQYKDQTGVLTGGQMQRYATRANLDFQVAPAAAAFAGFNFAYTKTNVAPLEYGWYMYNSSPLAALGTPFVASGNRTLYPLSALPFTPRDSAGSTWNANDANNLFANLRPDNLRNENQEYRTNANIGVRFKLDTLLKGLTFTNRLAVEYINNLNIFYKDVRIDNLPDTSGVDTTAARRLIALTSTAYQRERSIYNFNFQSYFNLQRTFFDSALYVDATLGYENIDQRSRFANYGGNRIFSNRQDVGNLIISDGVSIKQVETAYYPNNGFRSVFYRGLAMLDNRFLASFTIRNERSFLFNGNPATYFGFGGGWIISNEAFMKPIQDKISYLKLRASYGESGNSFVSMYPSITQTRYDYGLPVNNADTLIPPGTDVGGVPSAGSFARGVRLDSVFFAGNPNLKPEIIRTSDISLDWAILKNRIAGSFTYYYSTTQNMILPTYPLPASFSTNNPSLMLYSNTNTVLENRGFEITVSSLNMSTAKGFKWTTSFNIATNANKVLRIGDNTALGVDPNRDARGYLGVVYDNSLTYSVQGSKLGEFYLAEYAGVDTRTGLEMIYELDKDHFKATGQTRRTGNIIRATHENVMNNRFRQEGKTGLPTYWGGITNTFEYKGFDLMFLVAFQGGNYIYDMEEMNTSYLGVGLNNIRKDVYNDYWRTDNSVALYPALSFNPQGIDLDGEKPGRMTDRFLHRADYIRLRQLQIGYSLPKRYCAYLKLQKLRAYASVNNLVTISGYNGYTPEALNASGSNLHRNMGQGVLMGSLPQVRTWQFGVTVAF